MPPSVWRALRISEFEQRQLKEIRDELNHVAERTTPVVNAIVTASPTR